MSIPLLTSTTSAYAAPAKKLSTSFTQVGEAEFDNAYSEGMFFFVNI